MYSAVAFLFILAALSNAFLLFLVEPLVGKMVLPIVGGTPSVWNTVMLFFQTALLGGYLYAHVSRRLSARRQILVHAFILAGAALLLPVGVPNGWVAPGVELPLAWVFVLVGVMVGGPFFTVASAAPLIQRWFSATDHPRAHDPYFLYAATNAGSLGGLLAYPILVEPVFRLTEQAWIWSAGYVTAGALTLGCALVAMGRRERPAVVARMPAAVAAGRVPTSPGPGQWRRHGRWLILAFIPSSLMLGVTTHVTTDIAAFPLVLVVPLALYLLTFILAFARHQIVPARMVDAVYPLAALPVVYTFSQAPTGPFWLLVPLHLGCFFVLALGCHSWLARSRPDAGQLTGYYLWVALGGVLGGVFNGVVAPVVFDAVLEYPLVVVLACFVRPAGAGTPQGRWRVAADLVVAALFGAAVWPAQKLIGSLGLLDPTTGESAAFGLLLVAASAMAIAPRRYALAVTALVAAAHIQSAVGQPALYTGRSYFGVLRVTEDAQGTRQLVHGSTIHGAQIRDGRRDLVPAAYYSPDGPVGAIMRQAGPTVAVVGLGTGALACYATPGQEWTFFEIDPLVARIAQDQSLFTYLSGCLPGARLVIGDARVQLASTPDESYSAIVIDAFNSDAIPVHLLTREAVQLYLRKLAPGGIIALHISNRHLLLGPVLGRIAEELGLSGRLGEDEGDASDHLGSTWAILARSEAELAVIAGLPDWLPLDAGRAPLWTDDYANVMRVLRWAGGEDGT